ncbi:MAG: YdcF family protein [Bacteroidales bacterium]|nr:YdcF family protein [Bacteroidales bacterium]MCF8345125.1 YdcF family protein [Bacteroidales bacterium]MCF8352142.1 YdcF family protein [Bacteroidales bacterium]MCF8375767.1 YdcF family protein [Bacteroidales bacterium]MCF8402233.1 YdcF family protein [Bacteroidales bacterium]
MSPFLWILVLLIFALITRKIRRQKRLLFISLILLYFFSNSFIVMETIRLWEVPVTKTGDIENRYDVGIVLGGGMISYDEEKDRRTYRNNIDRLLQAIELYKRGHIEKLMLSGGSGNIVFRDMLESSMLKEFLVNIGIPEQDIIIDSLSENTYENAVFSAELLKREYPEGKFLLITSAIHMPRAAACFEKQGISTEPYSTNAYAGPRRYHFAHLFVPSIINFVLWDRLIHESLGYVAYWTMGYI